MQTTMNIHRVRSVVYTTRYLENSDSHVTRIHIEDRDGNGHELTLFSNDDGFVFPVNGTVDEEE